MRHLLPFGRVFGVMDVKILYGQSLLGDVRSIHFIAGFYRSGDTNLQILLWL
jgi:hypothetical protein